MQRQQQQKSTSIQPAPKRAKLNDTAQPHPASTAVQSAPTYVYNPQLRCMVQLIDHDAGNTGAVTSTGVKKYTQSTLFPTTTDNNGTATFSLAAQQQEVFAKPIVNRHLPEKPIVAVTGQAVLDTHYVISKSKIQEDRLHWHRQWLTLKKSKFEQSKSKSSQFPSNSKQTKKQQQEQNRTTTTTKKRKRSADVDEDDDAAAENVVAAENTSTTSSSSDGYEIVHCYQETTDTFSVPRAYGLSRWGRPQTDRTSVGSHSLDHVKFKGLLKTKNPNQVEILDELKYYYLHDPRSILSGILKLPTGSGKTVIMMALIAELKVPALILVHRKPLLRQTIRRVNQFLPDARVGIIQGKKCQVKDMDVVIGTLQTLYKKNYDRSILDHFGLVIVDEVHNVVAPTFVAALTKLRPRYLMGVSATPRRKNGLHDLLSWLIGPIIVERKRDWIPVHVRKIVYKRGRQKYNKNTPYWLMLNKIATDSARNAFLLELMLALLKDHNVTKQRRVLMLSHRLSQIDLFQVGLIDAMSRSLLHGGVVQPMGNVMALCDRDDPSKIIFSVGKYIGKMKPEEQEAAEKCNVILAIYDVARDGIDIPELDALVYGTPQSDVEQASGRILRPHDEKNIPVIVDLVDEGEKTEGMWWGRFKYYQLENMRIETSEVV